MAAKTAPRKKPATRTKPRRRKKPNPAAAIIDAALVLAAKEEWRQVTFAAIVRRAGVAEGEARRIFRSREDILAAFMHGIDRALLAEPSDDDAEDTLHNRLFELLMRRLDQLAPYRAALGNIYSAYRRQPWTALCLLPAAESSMTALLTAAGSQAPLMLRKVQGAALAVLWSVMIMPTWIKDRNPDLAQTMAKLDRLLRRVEPLLDRSN